MEAAAHPAESVIRICHYYFRSIEGLSRHQLPGKLLRMDAHRDADILIRSLLDHRAEIAGIEELQAVSLAAFLRDPRRYDPEEALCAVAGLAADRGYPDPSEEDRIGLASELSGPCAMEGHQLKRSFLRIPSGHIHRRGKRALKHHLPFSAVSYFGASCNDVFLVKSTVKEGYFYLCVRILKVDPERLHFTLCRVGRRKPRDRCF